MIASFVWSVWRMALTGHLPGDAVPEDGTDRKLTFLFLGALGLASGSSWRLPRLACRQDCWRVYGHRLGCDCLVRFCAWPRREKAVGRPRPAYSTMPGSPRLLAPCMESARGTTTRASGRATQQLVVVDRDRMATLCRWSLVRMRAFSSPRAPRRAGRIGYMGSCGSAQMVCCEGHSGWAQH